MNKTAVIVGNGPSLADIPNVWLEQYTTFAANRIYLKEGFVPTYLTILDGVNTNTPGAARPLVDFSRKVKRFYISFNALLPLSKLNIWPDKRNTMVFFALDNLGQVSFSTSPEMGLYHGFSSSYVNIQLAHSMGFRRLLFVGLDHDYTSERGHHFHPDYWEATGLSKDDLAKTDLMTQTIHYKLVAPLFDEVLNLTPGSKLDVFPIDDWRNHWLKKPPKKKRRRR